MQSNSLERIAVVGSSGSGKTTFAAALAESLGIPAVDLDALHWGPNWTPRRKDDFHADLLAATAGERWIVSGNYREARPLFWPRVTTVVWLNYSFPVVFNRALRRTVRRIITQEPICNGNRESFRLSFCSRESVLLWVLTTFQRRRREYAQMRVDGPHSHLEWIEFRRPREADEFLTRIAARAPLAEPSRRG